MLREVSPSRVAVIRHSGSWSEANYDEHLAKLQAAKRNPAAPGIEALTHQHIQGGEMITGAPLNTR
jgi:hypothetical protein